MNEHALHSTDNSDSGSWLEITALTRRAGIPVPVHISPGLVAQYRFPSDIDLTTRWDVYDLAWATRLALNELI
jgi:hypothetical protein